MNALDKARELGTEHGTRNAGKRPFWFENRTLGNGGFIALLAGVGFRKPPAHDDNFDAWDNYNDRAQCVVDAYVSAYRAAVENTIKGATR